MVEVTTWHIAACIDSHSDCTASAFTSIRLFLCLPFSIELGMSFFVQSYFTHQRISEA
jgi:hypothetical protein